MVKSIIAPSMLSSDFARLKEEAERMLECSADWLHMDVMDGHFVNNLTLGAPIVKCLRSHTDAFLDCHLMVSEPEKWVKDFAEAGASSFTFHIEASKDPVALCERVHEAGMRVGIAVKPGTSLDATLDVLTKTKVDMVLVMTVEPGFGGQAFMADMMPKVSTLRKQFPDLDIQVDGGIKVGETVEQCAKAGANVIVSGSGIFKAKDPKSAIAAMKASLQL